MKAAAALRDGLKQADEWEALVLPHPRGGAGRRDFPVRLTRVFQLRVNEGGWGEMPSGRLGVRWQEDANGPGQ